MYDDDALEWESTRIDKSRPPLRWIANLSGEISSSALMRMSLAEEGEYDTSFRYKVDCFLWDKLWPIYSKWGTFYEVKIDREED